VNALLLVLGLVIPRDTVLISLELVETSARVTVEAVQQDSTLLLPSSALRDLLGITMVGPWTSLEALRRAYPTITVQWQTEQGRVLVFDELAVLPAVRRFREQHRASAFGTAPIPQVSGPFGSLSMDDQKRSLAELGYTWRGRVSVFGRMDDRGVAQWNASAAPTAHLFLGGSGGTGQRPSITSRLQAGPFWLLTTYVPQHPLEVAGLVRGGPVQVFASRQFGMLTITSSPQWTIQLAQRWVDHRTAGRLSFGPTYASPFSFPVSSISH